MLFSLCMKYAPANCDNDEDTFQSIGLAAGRVVSNLVKSGELPEVLDSSSVVSEGSLNRILKIPKADALPFDCNPSVELSTPSGMNALKAGPRGEKSLVRIVLLARRLPQIRKSIVGSQAIDMVHKAERPFTCDVKPCQPRGLVEKAVDTDDAIPMQMMNAAGNLAEEIAAMRHLPTEDSRLRIVINNRPEPISGQISTTGFVRHDLELAKESHEDAGSESDASNGKEQRGANHSEAVAHGVKKIIAFEQRARGKKSGSG